MDEGTLLVLEELDVPVPDELLGHQSTLGRRRRGLEYPAAPIDGLEAGEDRRVVDLVLQERT